MYPVRILIIVFLSLIFGNGFGQLKVSKEVSKNIKSVSPEDIKAHIKYLADDRLRGRMPGTPGYQIAVDYVIDRFEKMNVQPSGDNGTYLQKVKLRKATTGKQESRLVISNDETKDTLSWGKDFLLYPNFADSEAKVQAPLVFAGFGIHAPDLGYDDYAGVDAKGKVVIVLRGAPENFPSTIASHSQNIASVLEAAYKHGAIGVLVGTLSPRPLSNSEKLTLTCAVNTKGEIFSRVFFDPSMRITGSISASVLNSLFKNSSLDLQTAYQSIRGGKPASSILKQSVQASYISSHSEIESYNVIGIIPGSDPELKNEYVVHSAHLDHVGVGNPIKGDSIYNGAHDNASGVASLLEIAGIYSRLKEKPKRSILFVFVTAEEMGLLGSSFFANNPTVPKDKIVADINTDMPTLIAPLLAAVPLGAEHSTLKDQVANACAYLGLEMEEDPEPEQVRFIRSDQYSFVLAGIPALHIKYGNKSPAGVDLDEKVKSWRSEYYHKPQDGLDGIFDFNAGKTYVQLNFLISYQVAQNTERPSWNKGDFFGERYGKK
jgi:hypothetical protein